ncbi:ATP-binding cassette domain-containing protein [Pseudomonas sp. RA_15y_Pfl1_P12]|uniref:ATP-binding cassette domain-containing protein n=1 Tax=unclassified Pseudomonas TaxID=196821 RepID=UPI00403F4DDB
MTGDDVAHIQRRGDRGKWWSKGQPRQILGAPQHDYIRALIAAADPATAKRWQDVRAEDATFVALEDLSLQVYPGQTLTIVGESGSGKSTALRIAISWWVVIKS